MILSKSRIWYSILFFIILFVCGCSKNKQEALSEKENITFDENGDQSFWTDSLSNMRKTNNGYYFFKDDQLYFIDSESMIPILLCTAPNCDHMNSQCNAYFGAYGDDLSKGFYTNALFSSEEGLYTIGYETSEVTDLYLYKINKDGTEREKIGYLSSLDSDGFVCNYIMYKG